MRTSARVREGWAAAGCLAALIPVFFWDMFFLGRGFFYGDYRMQYYPWALELSRALKRFALPFWSDKNGAGFPLLAEGQIGALHPLKWILYGPLPIEWGYPLGFWILFLAAGWFSYRLLRRLGGSWAAGIVAAIVFCYGSAYAGLVWGSVTLWVLAWLPWAIDRAEALVRKPGRRNTAKLALVLALLWLGGAPQIALYATLFTVGYVWLRGGARGWEVAACGLAAAVAAAQLLPTFELVAASARSQTGLDFALQKSMNPANLAAFVQPGLAFFGADLYMGLLPLILAILAAMGFARRPAVRPFVILTIIMLLFALGKWNPAYAALIDAFHLYALRAPSKWLLFSLFGLAVLAGLGWDRWWDVQTSVRAKRWTAIAVLLLSVLAWLAAFAAARNWGPALIEWGEHYVRTQVYGRGGHPHSLEAYLARIPDFLRILVDRTSFTNYYVRCTAIAAAAIAVWLAAGAAGATGTAGAAAERLQPQPQSRSWLKAFGFGLLVADLFGFSFVGSGFQGNRTGKEALAPDAVTRHLAADPELFRVYEFVPDPLQAPRWVPNANLIAGYASVGLYTPLAPASYAAQTERLGAVDASLGASAKSEWVPLEEWSLLSRLNVKYLMSRSPLVERGPWEEVVRAEDGTTLYRNPRVWPRAYAAGWADRQASDSGSGRPEKVEVTQSAPGAYQIEVDFAEAGKLVVSEHAMSAAGPFRSGWSAWIDGKPAAIELWDGGFLSVKVDAGKHRVKLAYVPTMFWIGLGGSLAALVCAGALIRK